MRASLLIVTLVSTVVSCGTENKASKETPKGPPGPQISVDFSNLNANGPIKQTTVATALTKHQKTAADCFAVQLARTPGIKGRVALKFSIAAYGRVTQAESSSISSGMEVVAECVVNEAKRWTFPPSVRHVPTTVSVELTFLVSK